METEFDPSEHGEQSKEASLEAQRGPGGSNVVKESLRARGFAGLGASFANQRFMQERDSPLSLAADTLREVLNFMEEYEISAADLRKACDTIDSLED